MPVAKEDWEGLLHQRRIAAVAEIAVEFPLPENPADRGFSRPFRAQCSDGNVYFIKPSCDDQFRRIPIAERVVAGCGRLIGAPVCKVALIEIPSLLDGEELDSGRVLRAGIAHGSLEIPHALFDKRVDPQNRSLDDNRRRHAGYFALYDWCWGEDRQWLYDADDEMRTYSHDHGNFLPEGPNWTIDSLLRNVHCDHRFDGNTEGIPPYNLVEFSDRMSIVTRDALVSVLAGIPIEWPVTDEELEILGYF